MAKSESKEVTKLFAGFMASSTLAMAEEISAEAEVIDFASKEANAIFIMKYNGMIFKVQVSKV